MKRSFRFRISLPCSLQTCNCKGRRRLELVEEEAMTPDEDKWKSSAESEEGASLAERVAMTDEEGDPEGAQIRLTEGWVFTEIGRMHKGVYV